MVWKDPNPFVKLQFTHNFPISNVNGDDAGLIQKFWKLRFSLPFTYSYARTRENWGFSKRITQTERLTDYQKIERKKGSSRGSPLHPSWPCVPVVMSGSMQFKVSAYLVLVSPPIWSFVNKYTPGAVWANAYLHIRRFKSIEHGPGGCALTCQSHISKPNWTPEHSPSPALRVENFPGLPENMRSKRATATSKPNGNPAHGTRFVSFPLLYGNLWIPTNSHTRPR